MKAGRRAAVLAAAVVATPAVARAQDRGALDFRGRFEALAVNAEGLPAPSASTPCSTSPGRDR